MGVFEMVVAVVAIGCVSGVLGNYFKSKRLAGTDELIEIEDRLAQLDEMEERIRVLEAVVTEENYQLKKQFEHLERGSPT